MAFDSLCKASLTLQKNLSSQIQLLFNLEKHSPPSFLPSFLLVQGYVLRFYFNKTSSLVPKLVLHSRLPNSSPNCFPLDLVSNLDRIWFGSSYIFNGTSIVQPIKSYHLYQLHAPNPQNLYTYLRHVPKVTTTCLMPPSPNPTPKIIIQKSVYLELCSPTNNMSNPS